VCARTLAERERQLISAPISGRRLHTYLLKESTHIPTRAYNNIYTIISCIACRRIVRGIFFPLLAATLYCIVDDGVDTAALVWVAERTPGAEFLRREINNSFGRPGRGILFLYFFYVPSIFRPTAAERPR